MRRFCGGFFFAVVMSVFFSCGSTPKNEAPPANGRVEVVYQADPSEAVSIAVPERKNRAYFDAVAPSVLSGVENGSPDSLKASIGQLRKNADSQTESERVLLSVAVQLLQIVWPSEAISVALPEVTGANAYLGAIDSARQGVYDSSTGKTDFLTKLLPSLVLVTSTARSDYYAQAQADLTDALSDRADSVIAHYLLGVLYRRSERYADAVSAFERAAQGASDCFEIAYALAQARLLSGNASAAEADAQALLLTNGANRDLLKLSAESAFAAGDLDAAEQYVARVLQQESDNAYYILFRAKILVQKGEFIKAASLLDVYARTDTTSRDYLVLRSKVQKDWNRNTTAAVTTIEQALRLYPDDTEIIRTAAELSVQTGQKIGGKTAGELAAQILEKDPQNVAALQIQIAQMQQAKNYSGAYKASSSLLELSDAPADAVYTHIAICLSMGRNDEAWQLVSRLYSDKPSDEQVLQAYIQVLVSTGRNQEASRMIAQQLPGANARMKSFLYYERSYLAATEDAILGDLRSSLTSNPRNKDALMRLYQIYYRKKEYRKAQYYLKQVVALSPGDESLLSLNRDLDTLLTK